MWLHDARGRFGVPSSEHGYPGLPCRAAQGAPHVGPVRLGVPSLAYGVCFLLGAAILAVMVLFWRFWIIVYLKRRKCVKTVKRLLRECAGESF